MDLLIAIFACIGAFLVVMILILIFACLMVKFEKPTYKAPPQNNPTLGTQIKGGRDYSESFKER